MRRFIVLSMLFMFSVAQAQLMGGPGAPGLSKGDIIVGGKLGIGSVYGANVGIIADAEYGLKEGFLSPPRFPTSLGVGAQIGFSSSNDYSNFVILGTGYWHIDLLKKKEFDTYVKVSMGFDIDSGPNNTNFHLASGSVVGIRYYFIPKLAAVAEVGYGMGNLRVGLDFKI